MASGGWCLASTIDSGICIAIFAAEIGGNLIQTAEVVRDALGTGATAHDLAIWRKDHVAWYVLDFITPLNGRMLIDVDFHRYKMLPDLLVNSRLVKYLTS